MNAAAKRDHDERLRRAKRHALDAGEVLQVCPERPAQRCPPGLDTYRLYEARKSQWVVEHPEATAREYEAAMVALAKECGV